MKQCQIARLRDLEKRTVAFMSSDFYGRVGVIPVVTFAIFVDPVSMPLIPDREPVEKRGGMMGDTLNCTSGLATPLFRYSAKKKKKIKKIQKGGYRGEIAGNVIGRGTVWHSCLSLTAACSLRHSRPWLPRLGG